MPTSSQARTNAAVCGWWPARAKLQFKSLSKATIFSLVCSLKEKLPQIGSVCHVQIPFNIAGIPLRRISPFCVAISRKPMVSVHVSWSTSIIKSYKLGCFVSHSSTVSRSSSTICCAHRPVVALSDCLVSVCPVWRLTSFHLILCCLLHCGDAIIERSVISICLSTIRVSTAASRR